MHLAHNVTEHLNVGFFHRTLIWTVTKRSVFFHLWPADHKREGHKVLANSSLNLQNQQQAEGWTHSLAQREGGGGEGMYFCS